MAREGRDLALDSNGCKVSHASCKHEELASYDNITDGSRTSFWATTGLYPHQFILSFPALININAVKIRSYYMKTLVIERTTKRETTEFEELKALDLQLTDLHHQVTELKFDSIPARHLRFHVKDGYDDFCAIYKVEVLGSASASKDEDQQFTPLTSTTTSGPMRTDYQMSGVQTLGRSALAGRQPQGIRTVQSTSSTGLGANGVPPSASSARRLLQSGNLDGFSNQVRSFSPPSTGSRDNANGSSDRRGFREEDW